MKILLCNLIHTGMKKTSEAIPLGIGYVASYLKANLAEQKIRIESQLLMHPAEFDGTMKKYNPSMVGFSNYLWNTRLSRLHAAGCKAANTDMPIIFGGPDFPAEDMLRKKYLNENHMIDFYVIGEGEVGMANIARRFLECKGAMSKMKNDPIDGVIFIDSKGNLVKPQYIYLLPDLNSFSSPILNGLMDPFLIKDFTPMIQYIRGCPYQCTYCNEGITVSGSVRSYPVNRVIDEILYLEQMHKKFKGGKHIIIADANFGMNKEDHKICELLQKTRERTGWPDNLEVSTGKSNKERLIKNLAMIKDSVQITLALQSMNEATLKQIKRINFTANELIEITNSVFDKNIRAGCELIVPLPEETFRSYLGALRYCLDLGMKVHTHTLVMLMETPIAQSGTVEEHRMKTKYRVLYRCFGNYNNHVAIETEKVCIATKDYSFEDYVATRVIGCVNGIFVLNEMFAEMRAFIIQEGLSIFEWLMKCYKYIKESDGELSNIVASFKKECVDELWEKEEELFEHFSRPENFKKLLHGEEGRNLITTYQGIVMNESYGEAVEIAKKSLIDIMRERKNNIDERSRQAEDLAMYLMLQNSDCFDDRVRSDQRYKFSWDINRWAEEGFVKPLASYDQGATLVFSRAPYAREQLQWYLKEYGNHPEGYGRILARIDPKLLKKRVIYK